MFEQISPAMLARMQELEAIDLRDRTDGTPQSKRLRQVSPDTGRFLALLAASAPAGPCIEIGTSAGYSTLWLALAARATGRKVATIEIDGAKVELARATFAAAGVEDVVNLVHGDALAHLPHTRDIGFCFLDAEKDLYAPCYDLLVPRMVTGGLLVADNAISHERDLRPMLDSAMRDPRVDSVIVPIGFGDLVCRKK
jgi:predicted O-methyltransferase YrrM